MMDINYSSNKFLYGIPILNHRKLLTNSLQQRSIFLYTPNKAIKKFRNAYVRGEGLG